MSTSSLPLSSYRSAARSLGAKSAGQLAVAAAALAAASSADATVFTYVPTSGNAAVLSSANRRVSLDFFNGTSAYGLPAAHAGTFSITTGLYGDGDGVYSQVQFPLIGGSPRADHHLGRFALDTTGPVAFPKLIAGGTTIDNSTFGSSISSTYLNPVYVTTPPSTWAGTWANTTGYLGVKLYNNANDGNVFYGWVKISVNGDASSIIVDAFGYNDVSGAAITAGQTTPVPEPATSAALLALGAAGLVAYRRRKNLARSTA